MQAEIDLDLKDGIPLSLIVQYDFIPGEKSVIDKYGLPLNPEVPNSVELIRVYIAGMGTDFLPLLMEEDRRLTVAGAYNERLVPQIKRKLINEN